MSSTVLDLFRGAGGWSVACQMLGLTDIGVETMAAANATAAAAGHKSHDVQNVWDVDYTSERHEGLLASPPCQTFSQAGSGKGRQALDAVLSLIRSGAWRDLDELRCAATTLGDERTALVLSPLHAVHAMRPRFGAWEQVPSVLPVWEACAQVLRAMGYHVWTGVMRSEQYGVPQSRRRAVLIFSLDRMVAMPTPTHSRYYEREPHRLDPYVEPWVSMAAALQRPELSGWAYRANKMANGSVRMAHEPAPTLAFGHDAASVRWMPPWTHQRPATTVVGSFCPDVIAAPGYRTTVSRQHAEGSVRVSVAEAGVLQSFPADYPWQGATSSQYLQVGNAIPPLMARAAITEAAGGSPEPMVTGQQLAMF